MPTLTTRRGERRGYSEHYARRLRVSGFQQVWRDACDYAGLCHRVRVPSGQTVITPELVDVAGHAPTVLTVRLVPGMLAADVTAVAPRLANALGGARMTATAVGTDYARLVLHPTDPLGDPFAVREAEPDGFLGVGEDGQDVAIPWAVRVHSLFQGSSGYGKSTLTYAQLSPLAGRADVLVAGIDPSGLVFRPWLDAPGQKWRVSGLGGGLAEHTRVLEELCDEMDRRLTLLPIGCDNLAPSAEVPLIVVALEELSGLLRTVDADRKVAAVVRPLLGRLFSEGRKVAVRMLAVIPRADAAVLGSGIRDQCQLRVSFAVEPEGFRMAHPTTAGIDPDEHLASPPGVAAVTAPGLGTFRMRAGALPYAEYSRRVVAARAA